MKWANTPRQCSKGYEYIPKIWYAATVSVWLSRGVKDEAEGGKIKIKKIKNSIEKKSNVLTGKGSVNQRRIDETGFYGCKTARETRKRQSVSYKDQKNSIESNNINRQTSRLYGGFIVFPWAHWAVCK